MDTTYTGETPDELNLTDHTVSILAQAVAAAHIVQWYVGDRWTTPYPGELFEVGPILFKLNP